jgi:hypothetical protein
MCVKEPAQQFESISNVTALKKNFLSCSRGSNAYVIHFNDMVCFYWLGVQNQHVELVVRDYHIISLCSRRLFNS